MSLNVPYIPEDAPFSTEQRAWLNGMMAGLFSNLPQPMPAEQVGGLKFAVYFATQSGTAERLAKKMVKELKSKGHQAELASLEKVTPAQIAVQENALFFASTYGEGDPPDSVQGFRDALFGDGAPALTKLRYAVFALGDKNYEQFCQFGVELDDRLEQLGGTRLLMRVESDVEVDEPFAQWKEDLEAELAKADGAPAVHAAAHVTKMPGPAEAAQVHTRENPYHAELKERRLLTSESSSKQTMHLSFGLEESEVRYQAGDACGVIAENDAVLVEEILSALPFDGAAAVEISKVGSVAVKDALLKYLQATRLTRKIVQAFAEKAHAKTLTALLAPEQAAHLETYMYGRGLIDLLHEFPGVVTVPEELVAMLPRLAPRLYSISSSPAAHGREVHCTVAVVRYRSHNRERGGVASTMLADRVAVGAKLPVYIQPNKKFRLPADTATPMIMIGPGTGIAPFRAFLHERRALGHTGRNWLFFGERSAETDFLYRDELTAMCDDGHLTRMDTAFSRDQTHKVYVQDRMLEQGAELWRWLDEGAQLFVCGDASRMAKDVDQALHAVIEKHAGIDADAAKEYVSQLQDEHRYHRDVY